MVVPAAWLKIALSLHSLLLFLWLSSCPSLFVEQIPLQLIKTILHLSHLRKLNKFRIEDENSIITRRLCSARRHTDWVWEEEFWMWDSSRGKRLFDDDQGINKFKQKTVKCRREESHLEDSLYVFGGVGVTVLLLLPIWGGGRRRGEADTHELFHKVSSLLRTNHNTLTNCLWTGPCSRVAVACQSFKTSDNANDSFVDVLHVDLSEIERLAIRIPICHPSSIWSSSPSSRPSFVNLLHNFSNFVSHLHRVLRFYCLILRLPPEIILITPAAAAAAGTDCTVQTRVQEGWMVVGSGMGSFELEILIKTLSFCAIVSLQF